MESRTKTLDIPKKLEKFLVDNYPDQASWEKFEIEFKQSPLTAEEKINHLRNIHTNDITNEERYDALCGSLITTLNTQAQKKLNDNKNNPATFIQFIKQGFLTILKIMLDEKYYAPAANLIISFMEKSNNIKLSPQDKIDLLIHINDNISIGNAILALKKKLQKRSCTKESKNSFTTEYLSLIRSTLKDDSKTAPAVWKLIKATYAGITIKSLIINTNDLTILFKIIRSLRSTTSANEMIDFLQYHNNEFEYVERGYWQCEEKTFTQLVSESQNPWLIKEYDRLIVRLLSEAETIDANSLKNLCGWRKLSYNGGTTENCEHNSKMISRLIDRRIAPRRILELLQSIDEGYKMTFCQFLATYSPNDTLGGEDTNFYQLFLKLCDYIPNRMDVIDLLFAESKKKSSVVWKFFAADNIYGSNIINFTNFFTGLISEPIDVKKIFDYVGTRRFFHSINMNGNDDYYFSPKNLAEKVKVAQRSLFHLSVFNKLLDVGATPENIIQQLEMKNDVNLNMGHYVFENMGSVGFPCFNATNVYLDLLVRLIKAGISTDRVLSLLVIDVKNVSQTHFSALMFIDTQQLKTFTNFLIALSNANVDRRQIHTLVSATSLYWGEGWINDKHRNLIYSKPHTTHTFIYNLCHYKKDTNLSAKLLFSLAMCGLIPKTEFCDKLKDVVFAHIKTLGNAKRISLYDQINDAAHPLGQLFRHTSFPASMCMWGDPAMPRNVLIHMQNDAAYTAHQSNALSL